MERFRQTAYSVLTMVAALVSLLVVSACEHDFYETGDSELSYLHTDFVEDGQTNWERSSLQRLTMVRNLR